MLDYTKPERILLKGHLEYKEKRGKDCIEKDSTVLGLEGVVLCDRERNPATCERLDMLLQEPDTKWRYEVELQPGVTDESHKVRRR